MGVSNALCLFGGSVFLLVTFISSSEGHGFLSTPAARNVKSRLARQQYCPHCFNGGGTGNVAAKTPGDGGWPFPETKESVVRHGLCGDPTGPGQKHMQGGAFYTGEIVETYTTGAEIEVKVGITAHHNGHFELFLCDKGDLEDPSGPVTLECLQKHPLVRVADPAVESPLDARHPGRFHLPPKCAMDTEQILGLTPWTITAKYRLPAGVACEHCVLQWYYVTANSCLPPGYREVDWPTSSADCSGDGGARGWWAPQLQDCGDGPYPEEFWNCADIRIVESGSGGGGGGGGGGGNPTPAPPTARPSLRPTRQEPAPTARPTASPPTTSSGGGGGGGGGGDAGAVDNTGFARAHGKLRVSGARLVDAAGAPVQLQGMSSHGLHWFPQCYTKASIQHLVESWGINLFRAAMYIGEGGYATDPSVKARVEDIVRWCGELGIYVMIDWHVLTPGDPNAWLDSQGAGSGLAVRFWEEMAEKYKGADHVIYEIANEPNNVQWGAVKAYSDAVIGAIRAIDPDTVIIVGTPTWSQDIHIAAADPVAEPANVMYAFHFYAGTHSSLLSRVANLAATLPIFATEWGTSEASGNNGPFLDVARQFLDLFQEKGISWAQWSFADKAETSAALSPGACARGAWDDVSASGAFVRDYIRAHVQRADGATLPPTAPTAAPRPTPRPSAPPPTPRPSSRPTASSPCRAVWEQCGGKNWKGATCCSDGLDCVRDNKWYSQCKPGSDESTPTAPPPTARPSAKTTGAPVRAPSPSPPGPCSAVWEQCGGKNWKGATCCSDGLDCVRDSKWYSQCLPRNENGQLILERPAEEPVEGVNCGAFRGKRACLRRKAECAWKKKKCRAREEEEDDEEDGESQVVDCASFKKKKGCLRDGDGLCEWAKRSRKCRDATTA